MLRRQAALDRKLELARADSRLHDILRLGAYQLRAQARIAGRGFLQPVNYGEGRFWLASRMESAGPQELDRGTVLIRGIQVIQVTQSLGAVFL